MSTGISLHIGLNYVDPNHYSGWNGKLDAAEFDAVDMSLIASTAGFQTTKFIRSDATRNAVITAISNAASTLQLNDILLISFSGHGGQLPDLNSDEDDGLDETWCLFDGELVDDELFDLWSQFTSGVRILVISDSCHSGTIVKVARDIHNEKAQHAAKYMPHEIASNTYFKNKSFYDKILTDTKVVKSQDIQSSVLLISGCQDNQYSYDGTFNGQFTGILKKVWNGGKFSGDYWNFYKQIMNMLPPEQTPNYFIVGQKNQAFEDQKPFTI